MNLSFDLYMIINIAVVVFYLFMIFSGAKTGFLLQAVSILGLFVTIYVSNYLAPILAEYVDLWPHSWSVTEYDVINKLLYGKINYFAWFIIVFLILNVLLIILKPTLGTIQKIPVIKQINEFLGGILGVVNATVWVLLIIAFLTTPIVPNGTDLINKTYLSDVKYYSSLIAGEALQPLNDTETLTSILNRLDELNNEDKQWLRKWLDDNNFKDLPIEEFTQKQ